MYDFEMEDFYNENYVNVECENGEGKYSFFHRKI